MDIVLVDEEDHLEEFRTALRSVSRVALDCEAAGFHRYSDQLCLVQLTAGDRTWLLDPLAVPLSDALRPVVEDPDREVVMHGADFDMRLLDRDLGIRPRRLFDTQVAASLLGRDGLGLAALLDETFGVKLSKKYQRADWARRPLPRPMQEYAALDTVHLLPLADRLGAELRERGRMAWAQEEFRELEKVRHEEPEVEDPAARLKAARKLSDREVHRLREALEWRDAIARDRDRAPFRVAGDHVLVDAARQAPGSVDELADLQGLNTGLARRRGDDLVRRFREVEALEESQVQGLPPRDHGGRGRPDPEVEERMRRLKAIRNRRAAELGIARGTLLPNAVLLELAADPPTDLDAMRRVEGVRRWQVEALGRELLAEMARTTASSA